MKYLVKIYKDIENLILALISLKKRKDIYFEDVVKALLIELFLRLFTVFKHYYLMLVF